MDLQNNSNRKRSGMPLLTVIILICLLLNMAINNFMKDAMPDNSQSNNTTSQNTSANRPDSSNPDASNPGISNPGTSDENTSNSGTSNESSSDQNTFHQTTTIPRGSATTLKGRTVLVSIFVNTDTMNWDYDNTNDVNLMYNTIRRLNVATEWIVQNTAKWGARTEFVYDWSKDNELFYLLNSPGREMQNLGDANGEAIQIDHEYYRSIIANDIQTEHLTGKYNAENIGYLFFFNTPMEEGYRCYTSWRHSDDLPEYCFMAVSAFGKETEPAVYAHEILHLYGANDLYYANDAITELYVEHCKQSNSNDIMYADYDITGKPAPDRITNEYTELDAYYTGLTDTSREVEQWNLGKEVYAN